MFIGFIFSLATRGEKVFRKLVVDKKFDHLTGFFYQFYRRNTCVSDRR